MTFWNRTKTDPTRSAWLLGGALLAIISLLVLGQTGAAGSAVELTPTPAAGAFQTDRLASPPQIDGNLGQAAAGGAAHRFRRGSSTHSQPENFADLALLDPALTPTATQTATSTRTPTRTPTPTASPTPVQTIAAGAALPIGCDEVAVGDTTAAVGNVDWYACAPGWPENGPENVYLFSAPGGVTVDALLGGLTVDLDLFVLTGANPASCIAHGDNSVSLPNLAAGQYYLVVDGFDGAAGPYRLSVWCPLDPTPQASPTPTASATPQPGLLRLYLPLISARP